MGYSWDIHQSPRGENHGPYFMENKKPSSHHLSGQQGNPYPPNNHRTRWWREKLLCLMKPDLPEATVPLFDCDLDRDLDPWVSWLRHVRESMFLTYCHLGSLILFRSISSGSNCQKMSKPSGISAFRSKKQTIYHLCVCAYIYIYVQTNGNEAIQRHGTIYYVKPTLQCLLLSKRRSLWKLTLFAVASGHCSHVNGIVCR